MVVPDELLGVNPMQENERSSSEILLIEKMLGGEKEIFHELIRPYERGAFVVAYSILRNQDDAEEVVQQSMLKIFTHLAELAERDRFKQWALRIVENEAKMYRRKRRQHLCQSLDDNFSDDADEKSFRPRQFADWRDLPADIV